MSDDTSVSLLERLRLRPDDASWKRLVDLYTPLIHCWLQGRLVAPADADDLGQEVLAVLVRELPHFEHSGRPGAFRSWLRTITVHRLRDFWRARGHRPEATGDSAFLDRLNELEDPGSGLSGLWDEEHDRHVVRRLLELIRSDFQPTTWQAFEGVMLRGEAPAAVAVRLGVSVNAVLLAKSRVLARLRSESQGLID
jgi:RNA polymerase sigma-70 factor (ECF subfamily)